MKVLRMMVGTALALSAPFSAMAESLPLVGDYRLDFFASSGACDQELFVRAEADQVVVDRLVVKQRPEAWGSHYRIGSFCRGGR